MNTPDYYNNCSTNNNASVPKNSLGFSFPHEGNAYVGFAAYYTTTNGREYIEVKLLDSLKAGVKYCVSFYLSLADDSKFATDGVGAFFSKDSISDQSTLYVLPYVPQIKNKSGNVIKDTSGWVLISDTLLAQGGEQFMIIGNFNLDSATMVDTVSGSWYMAYYYIDDVSVLPFPCDSGNGVNELDGTKHEIKIYPNPSDGIMQFEYESPYKTACLVIRDILGNKLREYPLAGGKNNLFISETALKNGIYFYEVMVNGEKVKTEKFIIIK